MAAQGVDDRQRRREDSMARKTSVIAETDPAYAGQAIYTRSFLRAYDMIVLRFSNRWLWRCPTAKLVACYEANVGAHHLDAGPGTGYFLDVADLPQLRRLVLIDPNPAVLDHAGRRLARFDPELLEANTLVPIDHPGGADSVACNYVLHCLPGTLEEKAEAIANLVRLLRPGGVFFGSTILADPEGHTAVGRRLLKMYNRKGVFGNATDTRAELERVLTDHLTDVEIEVHGAVAVFRGNRPA
jgi:SAM-dependent methyltransferase